MPITNKALGAITSDSNLRAKMMLVDGKSEWTIRKWSLENDDNLTMPKYTRVIEEHTGLKLSEILELEKVNS